MRVVCPACAVLSLGVRRDSQLVHAVPDSTGGFFGSDWLG